MSISSSGVISGTPTASGTLSFTVKVTDSTSATASYPVTSFVVAPAAAVLSLNCTFPTGAQVGVAYTGASCTASGGTPSYTYSLSGAPAWMSISSSGVISGTPTASGTLSFTVKVTDSTSATASYPVTSFVVAPAAAVLSLNCTFPTGAQVGVAYTGASCTASGGTPSYTYALSGAPAWMSISSTGVISGTPTASGTLSFTVKVTDSASTPATASYPVASFVVAPAAAVLSLNCTFPTGAQVGVAYTGASCTASGGTPSYTYSLSGAPAWMSISSTGVISGTPTASGTLSFTVKVTDSASTPATASYPVASFVVAPAAAVLSLNCTFPTGAQVGVAYSGASCTGSGGTPSYTYSLSGAPAWMSISSSGVISGTPTASGTLSFSVKVTDSASTPATASYPVTSFVVAPAAAVLSLNCTFPTGAQVGVAYTGASCTGSGGTPSYTYSLSGAPAWMSINSSTGVISGTPTASGTLSFTVKVTDSASTPATASYPVTGFVVAPAAVPLTLSCTFPTGAQVGVAYSGASCTGSGGTPSYTYSLSGAPAWMSISSSGVISGTPTASGTLSFSVKVTDSASTPATASYPVTSFVVAPAAVPLTLSCTFPTGAQVGVAYTGASCTGSGGTPSYTYSLSGAPAWMSINSSTGAISGTPTASGTLSFTVKVTDSESTPATASYPVTGFTVAAALTLNCTFPATAEAGVPYTGASCTGSGGTPAYTYSLSGNPVWMSINSSTGAISGTPTTGGTFTFTAKVTDSNATPQVASYPVTNFSVVSVVTLSCTLPSTGEVGVSYTGASCAASGGSGTYTYSLSGQPAWMSINATTGAISGTPTASGTFTFTAKAVDTSSTPQTGTFPVTSFSVAADPTLTCTAATEGVVGTAYSANCNASGGTGSYTYSVASGTVPNGLSLNSSNGAITGTPTAAGSFTFSIKVTDGQGQSASHSLSVAVASILSITTTTLSNGIAGVGYSSACTATGGVTPYTFAISGGALPTGLSLNTSTCAITGTPSASGTFNFLIRATDSGSVSQTATQPLSITVNPALAITSTTAPNGSVGLSYAYNFTAQYGSGSYTWSLFSGTLPAGLGLSSAGLLSGTPTTAASYTFTVKVTDNGTPVQTQTQAFTVSIGAGLTVTTTSLPNGTVGSPYSANLGAQNGVPPYTWSIVGSLPTGLSLSGSTISGNPSAGGTFNITARVTDSSSPTAQVATQALSITIASTLTLSSASFPNGVVGVSYATNCSASGGTTPYTFAIATGTLPPGLSLNTSNCIINGTPSGSGGTYNFSIRVTDVSTPVQSVTQSFSISINQGLTITSTSVPNGAVSSPYNFSLVAANGVTPYGWALTAGALAPGLTLNGSGTITGTPTTAGTYSFTVRVTDSSSQAATQSFSLVVNPATLTLTCAFPAGAQVGVAYPGATCSTTGGTPPYTYSLGGGALPGGLTLNSSTSLLSGNPTTPGSFSFTVKVTDSAATPQSATFAVTSFTVLPASAPSVPTFTLVGIPSSTGPGTSINTDTISLSTSSAAWPVTVTLTFTPNAAGVSAGYADPAMQFVNSSGTGLGTSYNVTIPALTNSVTLPQIAPGTVEGTIGVTLTVTGQTGASTSFNVPASVPIITPGSVQVLNVTSSGFNVELIANSSPRDLKTATFTFYSAGGAVINGTTTFTVDVTSLMSGLL